MTRSCHSACLDWPANDEPNGSSTPLLPFVDMRALRLLIHTMMFSPPVRHHRARGAAHALSALALLALAACGQESGKPASQVAAKVNKEEISVHQINFVMQRTPGVKPEQAETAGRQVLERLIDQEVAVQKAQEQKLDRDPRVLQELEAARRDIVARAYLAKVGDSVAKPATDEIKAYYDSKPALFAERRIYSLQELVVDGSAEQIAALQQVMSQAKSLQQVVDHLKAEKLSTRASQNTVSAENLPLALLDRFAAMKDGQTVLLPMPGGARLLTLAQSRNAPVTEEQARPAIEQFLMVDRRRKAVEQDLRTIRAAAHVEYVGNFTASAASAPVADAASAPVAPPITAAAPLAPAASAGTIDADSLNKGLSGLK